MTELNKEAVRELVNIFRKHGETVQYLGRIKYDSRTTPPHLMVIMALEGAHRGAVREVWSLLLNEGIDIGMENITEELWA
ncbi:MAG: hypothetical protein DDT33_01700 [Firmicutes bacterium]|nr:hypothetical protein [Bacillota bacterium]